MRLVVSDIIALFDAGAYGYTVPSRCTGSGRCPEVLIKGTQAGLVGRGETLRDLTAALERPAWQQ